MVWPTGVAEVRNGRLYYEGKGVKEVRGMRDVANYDFVGGGFAMTVTVHDALKEKMVPFKDFPETPEEHHRRLDGVRYLKRLGVV